MSAVRALQIIEHLARRGPTSLRGLARDLGLPLGSTHRLMATLTDEGVVERTADDEWELSYRILQIAAVHLGRLSLPAIARPVLEQLAEEVRQTAFLAVRSRNEIVYLDKVQSDALVQLHVELGTRRPIHSTALGKSILALLPEQQRDQFLTTTTLISSTPATITEPAVLRRELEEIRLRGFATDNEEAMPGVHCIAVPLLDYTGRVVGAISIAGTDPLISNPDAPGYANAVVGAGTRICRRLGHAAPQGTVAAQSGAAPSAEPVAQAR